MAGAALGALLAAAAPGARAADAPPAGASVIGYPAAFFAAMNAPTAYDMLLRLPGFTLDDGSAVRGFAGAAGNVLIDGQRPASKTDDLISILRRIPAEKVARIDLIRGGQTGIDMQGKTVVANVIRKGGGGVSGAVTVAGSKPEGMPFDPELKLEGVWRGAGRALEGSLQVYRYHDFGATDGPHDLIAPGGHVLDISPMHNEALAWQNILTAGYETPALGGRLRLNLTLEDQPYDNLSVDHFQSAGTKVERDRQDATDGEFGARYSRALGGDLTLELFGLQHLNKSGSNSTFDQASGRQVFRLSHFGGESVGRSVLHWRPSPMLTVDGGGEYAYNRVTTRTGLSLNGAALSVPAGNVTVSEDRAEGFATATWRPVAELTLEGGARLEHSTIASSGDVALSKTLTFLKPRLVATWTPDRADQVRLRIEHEVGQLDFSQFVANAALNGVGVTAGNPDLTPQQDWTVEAAYERHFWRDGVAALGVQQLWLTDVIDRAPVFGASGVFDAPANIGPGTQTNLTVSWTLPLTRLGVPGMTVRGVGTWRFSRVTDPTTHAARSISGQHGFDGELRLDQDLPRWKLSWGIDSSLEMIERVFRFNEIDTRRRGSSDIVYVVYDPRPGLNIRVDIDNFGRRPLKLIRDVYAGPRDRAPLSLVDYQDRRYGMALFVRIRQTFG